MNRRKWISFGALSLGLLELLLVNILLAPRVRAVPQNGYRERGTDEDSGPVLTQALQTPSRIERALEMKAQFRHLLRARDGSPVASRLQLADLELPRLVEAQ